MTPAEQIAPTLRALVRWDPKRPADVKQAERELHALLAVARAAEKVQRHFDSGEWLSRGDASMTAQRRALSRLSRAVPHVSCLEVVMRARDAANAALRDAREALARWGIIRSTLNGEEDRGDPRFGQSYARCRECGRITWGDGPAQHRKNCGIDAALAAARRALPPTKEDGRE